MAMVAVHHPEDFPEMASLASASNSTSRRPSSRSQSRRAQKRAMPARQVAPSGWTMCECEADKEWVLCDRVEAMAAELAERFQHHLQDGSQEDEASKVSVADAEEALPALQQSAKEATMRRVQRQLEEEEEEIRRQREAQPDPAEKEHREVSTTATEDSASEDNTSPPSKSQSEASSKKQMTRAERKAAWRAAQSPSSEQASKSEKRAASEKRVSKEDDETPKLSKSQRGKTRRGRRAMREEEDE
eukprot:TRINITY_DN108540_c0_g1_i1.p1 TRINITY_DN108540_c0_g1~~TRINITY_DN108540_c0_g1_i1.p1  ORF type:complete len:245 (-),score=67.06 TRINITY_DN108540_c0_g1_i1:10-744(-)